MTHNATCGYEGGITESHDPSLHMDSEFNRMLRVGGVFFFIFNLIIPIRNVIKIESIFNLEYFHSSEIRNQMLWGCFEYNVEKLDKAFSRRNDDSEFKLIVGGGLMLDYS